MTEAGIRLFDPDSVDLPGMRENKQARVRALLERRGIEALWLLGPGHLRYLVGSAGLPADAGRGGYERASLVMTAGAGFPHLFTPYPETAPPELPPEFVHAALDYESEVGVARAVHSLCEVLGGVPHGALALDEYSPALFFGLRRQLDVSIESATDLVAELKISKSAEEIECIRRAQRINEVAMLSVQAELRPGLRQSDLSALFFEKIYALGSSGNGIDPIWQVMSPSLAEGPWTTHGGVAFPTCTTDRLLREGDVLWVDSGIDYHGYQSDFGRTFVVGASPSPRQLDQGKRWLAVVEAVLDELRPGVTGRDLTRRAEREAGGGKPWLDHFYLIHGVGTEAAEAPLIGTDLGEAFDESVEITPGMVLVLEPAIWEDGVGGYRGEEIVAVTEDGTRRLSDHTYSPYDMALGS